MKVYALAAGFATRMYPLTLHSPKPLLDIAGKPVLTRLLEKVLGLGGVTEVIVIGNEKFNAPFQEWARNTDLGAPIRVLNDGSTDDSNKLGAIGDIAFALERADPGAEDWLVVAGDNLIEFDLAHVFAEFKRRHRPTLLVRRIADREAQKRYNEVAVDAGGRVLHFTEKPKEPQSDLAAIAFYIYTPEVKAMLREYLAQGGNPDAPGYFIEWLCRRMEVGAVTFEGEWFDIGNLKTLEEARAKYAARA